MKERLARFLCLAAAFYLVGDAFLIKGPVNRTLHRLTAGSTEHLAARVGDRKITRSQLQRAIADHLWRQDQSATTADADRLETARVTALDELIDDALLDQRIAAATDPPFASEAEIQARLGRLGSRFESKGELGEAMKSQGIPDEAALRARVIALIRREKFVNQSIAPLIRTSDEEARQWFAAHHDRLALPERIEVRHLFISTLDHPPEEAKQKLATALADLTTGKKDFPTLAKELSEDPATKDRGGKLGWMTRERLPADFAAYAFTLQPGKPELFRTKLGWHLAEVTARKPAEPRPFEQAKPEILAALETGKRQQAIVDFRKSLRQSTVTAIEIFPQLPAL